MGDGCHHLVIFQRHLAKRVTNWPLLSAKPVNCPVSGVNNQGQQHRLDVQTQKCVEKATEDIMMSFFAGLQRCCSCEKKKKKNVCRVHLLVDNIIPRFRMDLFGGQKRVTNRKQESFVAVDLSHFVLKFLQQSTPSRTKYLHPKIAPWSSLHNCKNQPI